MADLPANQINISAIRRDYQLAELDEATAGENPLSFFGKWFAEAEAAKVDEVNAMMVATVDAEHKPHARVVLLKGLEENGFIFFTNYDSAKGHELAANSNVACVFFWKELERQVRIEGTAVKIPENDSTTYFQSRPENSRMGAWASPQSQVIASRDVLEDNYKAFTAKFSGNDIPRPPHWGGYCVMPRRMEFWQGRASRMHDRILFELKEGNWEKSRLAP